MPWNKSLQSPCTEFRSDPEARPVGAGSGVCTRGNWPGLQQPGRTEVQPKVTLFQGILTSSRPARPG